MKNGAIGRSRESGGEDGIVVDILVGGRVDDERND